jgi:hypothetical protein
MEPEQTIAEIERLERIPHPYFAEFLEQPPSKVLEASSSG